MLDTCFQNTRDVVGVCALPSSRRAGRLPLGSGVGREGGSILPMDEVSRPAGVPDMMRRETGADRFIRRRLRHTSRGIEERDETR